MSAGGLGRARSAGWGLLIGLGLTAATVALLFWVGAAAPDEPNIVQVEFAGREDVARSLLGGDPDTIDGLRTSIHRDWVFIVAYVATIVWWLLYGARHFRMSSTRGLARVLAWATVVAGLADAGENAFLYWLLHEDGANGTAARWATAFTIPKWLIIVCALPVAVAALSTGLTRVVRRAARHGGLPTFCPPTRTQAEQVARPWTRPPGEERSAWNTRVDDPLKPQTGARVGMCFSGGGIRSGTFNMGVLQVLSQTDTPPGLRDGDGDTVLERTTFLTCVSGGAYIAGSLQMLAHQARASAALPTFAPGSPEESHVRLHGRYLADNLREWVGAVARVLAGTLLNLLVFALVLFVLARPLGWAQHGLLFQDVDGFDASLRTTPAMWTAVGWTAGVGVVVLLVGTIAGAVEGTARGRIQTAAFGFLALAVGVLAMVWLLPALARQVPQWLADVGNLFGKESTAQEAGATVLVATAGGGLATSALAIINRPTPKPESGKAPRWPAFKTIQKWVILALPYAAGFLLAALALITYALFVSQAAVAGWDGRRSFFDINAELELWVFAGAAVLLGVLYLSADQTRWSLGPFYRRRLASAFSITVEGEDARELAWSTRTKLSEWARPHPRLPEVLVCAAANISEQEAAPPGRRATSFVFGADVVGGPQVGWASTRDFEAVCAGALRSDSTFISAMAISGAAFASAMGRHNKGSINSLLAASNARLGIWLPSPRYIAELRKEVPEPQYDEVAENDYDGAWVRRRRFSYLFKELFGTYRSDDRFVYLSDGGHYENLGLVELLRRKCRVILCFDASGDDLTTCGTFVEALVLAEEELGVQVEIDLSPLAPRTAEQPAPGAETALDGRLSARSVVRGRITYRDGTRGELVLAKASLTKTTPDVVLAHAARQKKPTFPNDSTGDQFFDHTQFNSYSELGRHIACEAARELEDVVLDTTPPTPPPPCPPPPPPEPPTPAEAEEPPIGWWRLVFLRR